MNIIINNNNNWIKRDVYRYKGYVFVHTDANRYEETASESSFFLMRKPGCPYSRLGNNVYWRML